MSENTLNILQKNGWDKTRVSVIIPVLNQEALIAECISHLLNQSYSSKLIEIIVIDNGSTDTTMKIVSNYPVKLLVEKKNGPAAARNAGIKIATGEILIFMDSDCLAHRDFVAHHVKRHNINLKITGKYSLIGGSIAGYNTNLWSVCDDICSWYSSHPGLAPRYEETFLPAANMSIAANLIDGIGCFDDSILVGEDLVFCEKIKFHGYKIFFEPFAKVYHYNRHTFLGFINHAIGWTKNELQLQRKKINRLDGTIKDGYEIFQGKNKGIAYNILNAFFLISMYFIHYVKSILKIIKYCLLAGRYYVFFLLPFIVLQKTIFGLFILKVDIKQRVKLKKQKKRIGKK